jgi:hypothetical protein
MEGYANLHLLPMYQKKMAYGSRGFPWSGGLYQGNVSYARGLCPVAEDLHQQSMLGLILCMHNYDDGETDQVIAAFRKVWNRLEELG